MELLFTLEGCEGLSNIATRDMPNKTVQDMSDVAERCRVFNLTVNMSMVLLGIPGALVCAIIAYTNSKRRSIASILLITNNVSSMLVLCSAVPKVALATYSRRNVPASYCIAFSWVTATMNCVNVWSLLLLVTTRFLAVAFPHTLFHHVLLGKHAAYTFIVIFVMTSLYCLRFFFSRWDKTCTLVIHDEKRVWIYVVGEFFLPVITILILSVCMAILIKRDRNRMYHMTYLQVVLFMKITLFHCVWIVVSILPSVIHFSVPVADFYRLADDADDEWAMVRLHVTEMLIINAFFFRHSADILIYLACSRRFRGALVNFLRLSALLPSRWPEYLNLKSRPSITMYTDCSIGSFQTHINISSARSMILAHRVQEAAV